MGARWEFRKDLEWIRKDAMEEKARKEAIEKKQRGA
jgi:hypothetical protein